MKRPRPSAGISISGDRPANPSDVAIVGMASILPGAGDVRTFWENSLRGFNAITEVPADRWDWRLYYDLDPKAPDKIVSKWGGFLPEVPFDPLVYGMPPTSLSSIEPVQLLLLEATRAAIEDAGYTDRPFERERTAVVLGMGGGAAQLAMGYAFRSYLPMLDTVKPGAGREALKATEGLLPEWTEDSFPGFLLNVAAGRLANRFDLGGANYTVDAACGSSLAAASLAVRELETGSADVVILGGADTVQNPFTYLAFSKTHAFSPRGRCRPFDASADGIVISEGVAVLVLKRLADAERDHDRIYAVIKGVGASSDGRAKGLTAPSPDGQVRAVRRAYEKAGISPSSVGYVEAHGTGTAVGDVVEVNAIAGVFRESGAARSSVAIGSVKSMIGHTKCAAGLAGLINGSLALHHKVLPPTIGVEVPNPKADLHDGPFHVSDRARPWLHADPDQPRRAGVSAFGFGGTNFHAVLEAYEGNSRPPESPTRDWSAELLVWRTTDRAGMVLELENLVSRLEAGAKPELRDLTRAVNAFHPPRAKSGPSLAIVARSLDDLRAKLGTALSTIRSGSVRIDGPQSVYYEETPRFGGQPVAFVFPGQGSQTSGMIADLAMTFDEVRQAFDEVETALTRGDRPGIGSLVFPPEADRERAEAGLRSADAAQPALAAASVGLVRLLGALGIKPDVVAGHSFGELVALQASGAVSLGSLAELAHDRGRLMQEALGDDPGGMAAISSNRMVVVGLLEGLDSVVAVNENGPRQTVIAGPVADLNRAIERAERAGIRSRLLPVAGAFHTARMTKVSGRLASAIEGRLESPPRLPIYSNLDAQTHPTDRSKIAGRLGEQLASPVRFGPMIEAMHADGARVFIEVGPGSVLTPLVGSILGNQPHLAVSLDGPGRSGITLLLQTLGRLVVAGLPVRLERLSLGRSTRVLDLSNLPVGDGLPPLSATTWMVNGSRSRPIGAPEPRRLGQGSALPDPAPESRPVESVVRNGVAHGHLAPDVLRNGKVMNPRQTSDEPQAPARPTDDRVMLAFQETMRTFLEVQRSTMMAYLAGRSGLPPQSETHSTTQRPEPVAQRITSRPPPIPPRTTEGTTRPEPALQRETTIPEPAPAPEPVGRDSIAARLVEIVRDRTGYPSEMLGLELDLEADLGIDSIKRVEILGTLRDSVPALNGASDSQTMEVLSRAKTLGAIVDRVAEIAGKPRKPVGPVADRATSIPLGPVRRLILEAVASPLSDERAGLEPGGVVVVTDDGRGIGQGIAHQLREAGHPVELVGPDSVNLGLMASVNDLLDRVRETGPIAGIVHVRPMRKSLEAGLDPALWTPLIESEVKGLFLLAKGAGPDLERASRRGGAALVAATPMGGALGSRPTDRDFFPGHGGVTGLVKTLAREWPGIRSRVVDLDPLEAVPMLVDRIVDEVLTDDGWSEVGYDRGRRIRLKAVHSPLDRSIPSKLELAPGEPVIVTGGARGITSTITAELVRRWRPTLLILGRSPLPVGKEDRETARISSKAELKAVLHARLRRSGESVTPADLDRVFLATLQAREIRANLEIFRSTGAVVEYAPVDIRDPRALAPVLEDWRRRFGQPVGLIHGAGVIKDKRIGDKSVESFDHVFGTKLDGALNLTRLLDPRSIKFVVLFSSIAGRFGNIGQSDYAAANDTMNKLAVWLDRRWPGRVVSINWGPWSGVGMVSELETHLGGRGLGMIPPELGRTLLLEELIRGRKGEVELIASGDLGTLDQPIERLRLAEVAR